ncbi:MAG: arylsulfatase [Planctomyces sp.]|nr:arylsulfatase [Planctomyces sp.]
MAQEATGRGSGKPTKKPNIVVIMGDDIGWFNIGAYHQGMMSGKTPNLDKLASQGMRFTDYYAEASCTAGRASFITGQIPLRTGLTTVGQAGADVGMPDKSSTIAAALKTQGYATGQFGKNHLGDLNKYLPTLHGFDEFHGYLYHLDAMSDPYWFSYPKDPAFRAKYGPRNVLHTWATEVDDPTVMPRWGKVGKQRIVDDGPLPPHPVEGVKYNMETVDDVFLESDFAFMDKAQKEGKPFFVWHNTTRMHIWTNLSEKYKSMMNSETNYNLYEAGMAQLDDIVGSIMKKIEDMGEADNTILIFTTDNGAEVFTWPDGGNTPFKGTKGMVTEGGFRAPCLVRWPGKIKAGSIQNEIFGSQDWFPTLLAAAGDPDVTQKLLKGVQMGDKFYKNHLDGYNQLPLLLGQGSSARSEIFYFEGPQLGAIRIDEMKFTFYTQPTGWAGPKSVTSMPTIVNLRQDPFERYEMGAGETTANGAFGYGNDFAAREFWRFVRVQEKVGALAMTAIEYPPMQAPASFNLEAVKKQVEEMINKSRGR